MIFLVKLIGIPSPPAAIFLEMHFFCFHKVFSSHSQTIFFASIKYMQVLREMIYVKKEVSIVNTTLSSDLNALTEPRVRWREWNTKRTRAVGDLRTEGNSPWEDSTDYHFPNTPFSWIFAQNIHVCRSLLVFIICCSKLTFILCFILLLKIIVLHIIL